MALLTTNLNIRGTVSYEAAHYRGLWQRYKNRLSEERAAHAEELRRTVSFHREKLRELEQSLTKKF